MNRVWSLEVEHFEDKNDFTFVSIEDVVEDDPHGLHLEIQRHTARIRTDLDAFSDLEISSLIKHGYCVTRHACRKEPEIYGVDLPDGPPWDPIMATSANASTDAGLTSDENEVVKSTRSLQYSARRRILSTLLSYKDWPTYVWVPLVIFLITWLPWSYYHAHQRANRNQMVIEAIADSNPMYRTILQHLERKPTTTLDGIPFEENDQPPPPTDVNHNIQVIRDARAIDIRGWTATDDKDERVYTYRSLRIRRRAGDDSDSAMLRLRHFTNTPQLDLCCHNERLQPRLIRYQHDDEYDWDLVLDLRRKPIGMDIDIVIEMLVPEGSSQDGWLAFSVEAETALAKLWVLMPENRSYDAFELMSYERDKPETSETEYPSNQLEIPAGDLIAFELVSPTADRFYECNWTWSDK